VANNGLGRSDLLQVGAFVHHTAGSAYITAAAAYGWQDTLPIVSSAAIGCARVNYLMSSLGGVDLTPYAAAQVTALDLPSYAETGGAVPTLRAGICW
jgi:hypothetical protein